MYYYHEVEEKLSHKDPAMVRPGVWVTRSRIVRGPCEVFDIGLSHSFHCDSVMLWTAFRKSNPDKVIFQVHLNFRASYRFACCPKAEFKIKRGDAFVLKAECFEPFQAEERDPSGYGHSMVFYKRRR